MVILIEHKQQERRAEEAGCEMVAVRRDILCKTLDHIGTQ